jgi:DDE superfamily endonuclease
MIHRTWPHIHVSSRRPRHAQEHRRRDSPGGASPDAGGAAARAVRLSAGPAHLIVGADASRRANYKIHKAKAVEQWLANHPRFELLFLPTYCPRANPIERAFGDVHDLCTRTHTRKRLQDLVADVEAHLQVNGPWKYKLSELYDEPAVTAAVEKLAAEVHAKAAA